MKLSLLLLVSLLSGSAYAGAALGAAGLVGTGYVAAPKTTSPQQIACEASTITIPLKVYINGKEIQQAK